jgi:hypothetical protein
MKINEEERKEKEKIEKINDEHKLCLRFKILNRFKIF